MISFIENSPSLESTWRSIILFGRNSASYKFALGKVLLQFADKGQSFVKMDELALPFANNILEHIKTNEKQGTSKGSKFLDALKTFNTGSMTTEELQEVTVRSGFVNVIDAFHNVNQGEVPFRFFVDEREKSKGIRLTDELLALKELSQYQNLPHEVEARWRLVETAWALNMSTNLLTIKHDEIDNYLFVEAGSSHRLDVTSSRDALNGYQKGKCFYCFSDISVNALSPNQADVDHFFPVSLAFSLNNGLNLNGVWNLVLSCQNCNRGESGKFAKVPEIKYLERLNRRNNFLISSHHPLRETIMRQTGNTEEDRAQHLNRMDNFAISYLIHRWKPQYEEPAIF